VKVVTSSICLWSTLLLELLIDGSMLGELDDFWLEMGGIVDPDSRRTVLDSVQFMLDEFVYDSEMMSVECLEYVQQTKRLQEELSLVESKLEAAKRHQAESTSHGTSNDR